MTLPNKITREQLEITHPDRDENVKYWQFDRDAYQCTGGFGLDLHRLTLDGTELDAFHNESGRACYLTRYSRESQAKFIQRTKTMHLPPYVAKRVISPLVGFLTAKAPERNGYPPQILDALDNITDDGLSFDEYMAEDGIAWGMVYGRLPHVIDSDPHDAENEAERLNMGAKFAKLRAIHTDRLLDWNYNDVGQLSAIKYETDMTSWDQLNGHTQYRRVRWITDEGTWYVDDTQTNKGLAELDATGQFVWQELDRAPLVELSFLGGHGIIKDMRGLVLDVFNKISQLDETQMAQCFNILTYPNTDSMDAKTLGAMMGLPFDPEARQKPEFITPSAEPLDHLAQWIEIQIERIQETANTSPVFSAGQEAAATMAYRFQTMDRFLQTLARSLVRFEYAVCRCLCDWYQIDWPEDAECKYAASFDVLQIERLLDQGDKAKNLIGLPPTAVKVLQRKVIDGVQLWGDTDETEAIEAELEESVGMAVPGESPGDPVQPNDPAIPEIMNPQPPEDPLA